MFFDKILSSSLTMQETKNNNNNKKKKEEEEEEENDEKKKKKKKQPLQFLSLQVKVDDNSHTKLNLQPLSDIIKRN